MRSPRCNNCLRAVYWWNGGERRLMMEWWQKRPRNCCMLVWTRAVWGDFCQINLWRSPGGGQLTQEQLGARLKLKDPTNCIVWEAEKWWNEGTNIDVNAAGRVFWGYETPPLHCLRSIHLSLYRMMAENQNSCLDSCSRHHIAQESHNEIKKWSEKKINKVNQIRNRFTGRASNSFDARRIDGWCWRGGGGAIQVQRVWHQTS